MLNKKNNIAIIIPALNEEKSIHKVLNDLSAVSIKKEYSTLVIVCDNGSTDKTAEIAEKHGAKVVHEARKGYGQACLTALKYVPSHTKIIVFMDADYSDSPKEINLLLEPILNNHYDMVIGSRLLGKAEKGSLLPQAIFGNWLSTKLIYLFWGFTYTDLGPFRAIQYSKFNLLSMEDKNFGWTIQMQIRAVKKKMRIKEVPVSYKKRIGKSKISGTIKGSFLAGMIILITIFRELKVKNI